MEEGSNGLAEVTASVILDSDCMWSAYVGDKKVPDTCDVLASTQCVSKRSRKGNQKMLLTKPSTHTERRKFFSVMLPIFLRQLAIALAILLPTP